MFIHPPQNLGQQNLTATTNYLFNRKSRSQLGNYLVGGNITHPYQAMGRQYRKTRIFHATKIHHNKIKGAVRGHFIMTTSHQFPHLQGGIITMMAIGDIETFITEQTLSLGNRLPISDLPEDMVAAVQIITITKRLGISRSLQQSHDLVFFIRINGENLTELGTAGI